MPASSPPFVITRLVGKDIAAKSLSLTGGTITTNTPVIDNTITWNNSGVTFTGLKLNATDTASDAASRLISLQLGGNDRFYVGKGGNTYSYSSFYSSAGGFDGAGASSFLRLGQDTWLVRDAANIFAQRNGTNAQAFRLYNTYTDASNYERVDIGWSANVLRILTGAAGTGTTRSLGFGSGNAVQWYINSSGHFLANTDNTCDIGASGTTRPRTGYFGTNVIAGGYVQSGANLILGATSDVLWNGSSKITSASDGVIKLTDNAATSFGRLQFGGTTSSFPSLKRSGTDLIVRLADDSGNASLTVLNLSASSSVDAAGRVTAYNATAIPAGGTTGSGIKLSSTTNFGVFFGSGAPTLSAAKGSLYLRSDGSTTNDRAYINTDGSTTWTAVTTAA